MNDYGHIDNNTPSFAISLYEEYRGKGIGTKLMETMLKILKDKGYKKTSLAVQKDNYAVKMYKKIGFKIIDENGIAEDDSYYEMFCMLLIPCYSKHEDIDDRILTGIKKDGRQIGDHFQIQCSCFDYNYIKQCMFSGIDEFISDKEKVIEFLKEKKRKKEITIVDIVSAEIGEHHNHVQADGKKFSTLSELSIKNKKVLKLFQNLGLFRIVFGRFTSQGVKAAGTMTIYSISKKNTQDIVTVKFNAETGFQIITDLYFPKGIGQLLQDYFKKNQITYKNMSELVDKI